jgi:hypothetical protein
MYVALDRKHRERLLPATAQRLVQSDQVLGHRDLTLPEQIFAVAKLPLSVEERQKSPVSILKTNMCTLPSPARL